METPMNLTELIEVLVEQKGSDLHIRPTGAAYIRRDGQLSLVPDAAFSQDEIRAMAFERMTAKAKRDFEERMQADYSFGLPGLGRFRVNFYLQKGNGALAIRLLSERVPTL